MSAAVRSHRPRLAGFAVGVVALALAAGVTGASGTATAEDTSQVPGACGPTQPMKADGTPWVCTFADDFDGTTLDPAKWMPQTTAGSNYTLGGDCFVDSPQTIAVGGGTLQLTTRRTNTFRCVSSGADYSSRYVSGMVMTYGRFAQAYGRFEIRAAMPGTTEPGLHSAMWLWPDDLYSGGEIDLGEWYSRYPDRVIPYLHSNFQGLDTNKTNNYCLVDDVAAMHTYVLEWTPDAITISYDGNVCLERPTPVWGTQPFNKPFFLALTQGVGVKGNAPDQHTVLPATMRVDYVRVWS
jgi:beta-glucanase (GH16 family)